jgi:N4-gp56 family major capsid protein
MAYTTTGSSSLGGTKGGAGLVQTAYDRMVEFELRDEPLIRAVADKRPARQAMPGDSVVLQRYVDLSDATTPLTETSDVTAVAVATPTQTTITLQEFGNAAIVTRKLQLFSLTDVDPDIASLIAHNMADSIDSVAMSVLRQGTNVLYGGDATDTDEIVPGDTITSALIRKSVAKLRGNKAAGRKGSMYWVGIHPDVSHDLRSETGASSANWRLPHEYSQASNIWAGEIGTYEGAYFVESARLYSAADGADADGAGAGTALTKVYRTIVAGKQALAEAVAEEPHTVIGPVTDTLKRFRPIGWYGVLGFARYREEALYRIETSSSIA